MKFVTNNVSHHPDQKLVLLKPSFAFPRRLLHPDYEIDELLMMPTFSIPGDTANLFCTPFLHCTSSALVALNVLTPQQVYRNRLPQYSIDALTTFTGNMYTFFVDDNHPLRSVTIVANQMHLPWPGRKCLMISTTTCPLYL